MSVKPVPQQIYRHFKGNLYQIISMAEHSETGEELVIYQALYGDFKVYARPLASFLGRVDREKYPNASQEYRYVPADVRPEAEEQTQRQMQPQPQPQAQTQPQPQPQGQPKFQPQPQPQPQVQPEAAPGAPWLDPQVEQFLDADSYEERLEILTALHARITDDMINTLAMAVDVEVNEGDIETRYEELRRCLLLYDKFECSRLR